MALSDVVEEKKILVNMNDEEDESVIREIFNELNKPDQAPVITEEISRPPQEQIILIKSKILQLIGAVYLDTDNRTIYHWEQSGEAVSALLVAEHNKIIHINEKNPYNTDYLTYLFDEFTPFLATYVEKILIDGQLSNNGENRDFEVIQNLIISISDKMLAYPAYGKESSVDALRNLTKVVFDEQTYSNDFANKFDELESRKKEVETEDRSPTGFMKKRPGFANPQVNKKDSPADVWRRFLYIFKNSRLFREVMDFLVALKN